MIFRRIHGRIIPIAAGSVAGSVYGSLAGGVRAAWKESDVEKNTLKRPALGTYKKNQTGIRYGAALGALAGALWGVLKK